MPLSDNTSRTIAGCSGFLSFIGAALLIFQCYKEFKSAKTPRPIRNNPRNAQNFVHKNVLDDRSTVYVSRPKNSIARILTTMLALYDLFAASNYLAIAGGITESYGGCIYQAFSMQLFELGSCVIVFCISLHLFLTVVVEWRSTFLLPLYIFLSIAISGGESIWYLSIDRLGPSGPWCWIKEQFPQFAFETAFPIVFIAFGSAIISFALVQRKIRKVQSSSSFYVEASKSGSAKRVKKGIVSVTEKRLILFICSFLLVWFFPILNRLLDFANRDIVVRTPALVALQCFFNPLMGLLDFLAYSNRGILFNIILGSSSLFKNCAKKNNSTATQQQQQELGAQLIGGSASQKYRNDSANVSSSPLYSNVSPPPLPPKPQQLASGSSSASILGFAQAAAASIASNTTITPRQDHIMAGNEKEPEKDSIRVGLLNESIEHEEHDDEEEDEDEEDEEEEEEEGQNDLENGNSRSNGNGGMAHDESAQSFHGQEYEMGIR